MVVPYPFTRAMFVYGEPIHVPRDGNPEEWRVRIEQAMNALAEEAEQNFENLWKSDSVIPGVSEGSGRARGT